LDGAIDMTRKSPSRLAKCVLGAALAFTVAAPLASEPTVIRGTGRPESSELRLAYQGTFPHGSLDGSVDHLGIGAMQMGDTQIAGSEPTSSALPGELFVSIHRPPDLDGDTIVANSVWATPVHFGPGSVMRISVTARALSGPIPGGGFAFGLVAKTGGAPDLASEPRIATTINVRPGFLVRLNVPFGSAGTTNTPLTPEVRDAIFDPTNPKPFTLSLTVNRITGKGLAELKVEDHVVTLSFDLADFLAESGPDIEAVGAGPAVNGNGPGQTASVHIRDFRIYTNAEGVGD
jgi:hypothetical protein